MPRDRDTKRTLQEERNRLLKPGHERTRILTLSCLLARFFLLTACDILFSCRCSSVVELSPCKRVAVGSSPTIGFTTIQVSILSLIHLWLKTGDPRVANQKKCRDGYVVPCSAPPSTAQHSHLDTEKNLLLLAQIAGIISEVGEIGISLIPRGFCS